MKNPHSKRYFKSVLFLFSILVASSMMSCKSNEDSNDSKNSSTESLEIFGVKPTIKEKDSLLYAEHLEKYGDKEIVKTYFDKSNTEVGKEIYLYEKEAKLPYGSDYLGPDDKRLSYYRYTYNDKNQKVMMVAFDVVDDEVLRYERYGYDANGYLAIKEISDADLKPNRQYLFENDKYGNVNTMTILGENADTIAVEAYKTTKMDNNQKWVEKWGFIDDNPKTFHIKTIK